MLAPLLLLGLASGTLYAQEHHVLTASDGQVVHSYLYRQTAAPRARALILAFHQGGADARGEYRPVVPRLLAEGFDVLAVDLRSGGGLFGGANRTVSARRASAPYCEAAADIEGALGFAREAGGGRVILWGSSYSAALALRAAVRGAERGISGVLAFSPATGPPMAGCLPEPVSLDIDIPTLILGSAAEVERGPLLASFEAYRSHGHEVFVARPGTHGSSMLVPDRVRGDVADTWSVVFSFLDRILTPPVRQPSD